MSIRWPGVECSGLSIERKPFVFNAGRMKRILLSPDSPPGTPPASVVGTTQGDPVQTPNPAPPAPSPRAAEPPPAARIVANAERTEREVELESELQAERDRHATTTSEKKQREIRIAELEDERRTLLSPPAPKQKKSKPFLPTLLHEADDDDAAEGEA
jgi:hypothetical protein